MARGVAMGGRRGRGGEGGGTRNHLMMVSFGHQGFMLVVVMGGWHLAGDHSRGEGVGEGYNNSIAGCVDSSSINLNTYGIQYTRM
jgi:hypothetical protein